MPQAAAPEGARHRFRIGPLLGAGTFGEVYLARMTSLHGIEQDVAVKLLNPGLDPRSQPVSRMRDEGRMLASLNHPAILHVMDFCFLDGRIGLVTEFVPGADLHDGIFGPDPIPARAALHVIGTVADALDVAWNAPAADGSRLELVHRDIKPANIRITPHGTVKLLDFGIAKSEDARRETETVERTAVGTPSYMAPEVQTFEVLDALPSRDVFALGCTLYEALARELFFEGQDEKAIVRLCNRSERFAEWRSVRMPLLARHGPRVLDLVSRMLRWDHTERPSAREVADLCLDLAERDAGESLRAWCRRRDWPSPTERAGAWTGRELQDSGVATRVPVQGQSGVQPLVEDAPDATRLRAAGPTLIVADPAHASMVQAVTPLVPGVTQVVVLQAPAEAPPPRRRAVRLTDLLASVVVLGVLTALLLLVARPQAFYALLGGDWAGALADAPVASLEGGAWLTGWSDGPELVTGEAWVWGAEAGRDAVIVLQDASQDALLVRPGEAPVAAASGARLHLPEGRVEIRAPGEAAGAEFDLTAGRELRVSCVEGGCAGY